MTNCEFIIHMGKKTEKDQSICIGTFRNISKEDWIKMCGLTGTQLSSIVVEENNGGLILARMLKKRNLAVTTKKAIKDKVTRLREYEGCFDRGEVFFLP